jgi:antitoxin FitA
MGVQITIRNVPLEVRDELAARAARDRKSMQEYLREELERLAARPTLHAWLEKVRERKHTAGARISAKQILTQRDADRR